MGKNIAIINNYIQLKLQEEQQKEVPLRKAAQWLHKAHLLQDSRTSPGFPLRRLAKKQKIIGAYQKKGRFWFIKQVPDYHLLLSVEEAYRLLKLKNKRSVYAFIKRHQIPHIRLKSNHIVFRGEDLYTWLVLNGNQDKIEENHMTIFQHTKQKIQEVKQQINSKI